MNDEAMLMPIRNSIPMREHTLVIGIYDKAYPTTKIPTIIPFVNVEKPKPPIPVCRYDCWTLEYIKGLTDAEIGRLVRLNLSSIEDEKKKIER